MDVGLPMATSGIDNRCGHIRLCTLYVFGYESGWSGESLDLTRLNGFTDAECRENRLFTRFSRHSASSRVKRGSAGKDKAICGSN